MKNTKGIILALVSSGTFGLIPLFSIPLMDKGMSEPSILFYRFLFSAIMMGFICAVRKETLKIPIRSIASIFVLGTLYAATALFLIYSYHYLPSGIATTINFLYPLMVSLFMILFFKEKKSIVLFLSAIIALLGVTLMCWTGGKNIKIIGVGIAAITMLTYSIYIVGVNQTKVGKLPAELFTFYILLTGVFIFFIYGLMKGDLQMIPNVSAFAHLISLAFLCTVVSNLALVLAIKYVGSTMTSILGSMEPVVAVVVGTLYFSEPFSLSSFFGIVLIIVSVIMVVMKNAKGNNEKPDYIKPNKK